jgi:hypothetical protein
LTHHEVNKKIPLHSSKKVAKTIEDAIISEHTLANIADGSRGKAATVDYSIGNVTNNIMIQSNLANIADEPLTFKLSDHELSAAASSSLLSKDGMNYHNSDNPICVPISGAITTQDVLLSSPKSALLVDGTTLDKVNTQVGIFKDVENIADIEINKDIP